MTDLQNPIPNSSNFCSDYPNSDEQIEIPRKRNKISPKPKSDHQKTEKNRIANAMADCVLPEEMILCILIRLPVKSILRFKYVCRPWRKLLSSPEFMQMHFHQFSGDPKSQNFIASFNNHQTLSVFSIACDGNKPRKLNLGGSYSSRIVGCCKGLVCMRRYLSDEIFLWNPALNLSKNIPPPRIVFRDSWRVLLGFGYDDSVGDFKVVRIVVYMEGGDRKVAVEVYSAKSDSWQTIKVSYSFEVLSWTNAVIVNGNPCWIALVTGVNGNSKCLLWFDVKKLVFKIVPLSENIQPGGCFGPSPIFVDWKGSLASIGYCHENLRVKSIYIWVFDEGEKVWKLNHTFRPIEMKIANVPSFSDNGKFIGKCKNGKFVLFDFETECVKVIEIDDDKMFPFKIYGYSESLVYIEGMEPVVVKERRRKRGLKRRHPKTYSVSNIAKL